VTFDETPLLLLTKHVLLLVKFCFLVEFFDYNVSA
jgi:hypothetical protein